MIYFKSENGKVLMQTKSKESAKDYNLTETCEDDGLERAYDGNWYLKGYAPEKPAPTKEEVSEKRRQLYIAQKDPITCQIQALKDEEVMTAEINAQIEALKAERSEVVAKIKSENPYPAE